MNADVGSSNEQQLDLEDRLAGCLLGTAVGDALGLPYEGLSRRRAARLLGPPDRFRLIFGRGMCSDDTEHAVMVAQALIASAGNPVVFEQQLARRLRRWCLLLPAGIGLATLCSCLRLLLRIPPSRSGVYSAGNGPAMRAGIIGAAVANPVRVQELTCAATRMTHTHPMAQQGALAVALASWMVAHADDITPTNYRRHLDDWLQCDEEAPFRAGVHAALDSVMAGQSTTEFAMQFCSRGDWGVSGYVLETVPVCLHAWLSNRDDFGRAVREVIAAGGDADTTAAITGGIAGATLGPPSEMLTNQIAEWPASVAWQRELARQLAEVMESGIPDRPATVHWAGLLLRNGVFLAIVLAHGLRRLLPPW